MKKSTSLQSILFVLSIATGLLVRELNALPWFMQRFQKRQSPADFDIVDCFDSFLFCNDVRIRPGDDMTVEKCCVDEDINGLAYQREGTEGGCRLCVVFGWREQSFTARESLSQVYSLTAGYIKGAEEHAKDIDFNVVPVLDRDSNTAQDITVLTDKITLRWEDDTAPITVRFKVNRDRHDSEGEETIKLRLSDPRSPPKYGENYFFFQDIPITIQDAPALCIESGINCNDNGCQDCSPRFTGTGCCDCEEDFFLSEDNQCEVPCEDNVVSCVRGVCTCDPGFGQPDCCQCDNFHYDLNPSDGRVQCNEACRVGVEQCTNGVCSCEDGYTGIDCCQCDSNYYRQRQGGECLPACVDNIESCSNGRCICQNGYSGPGCCDCANNYIRDVSTNRCIAPCSEGVLFCTEQSCECAEGYRGIDCCSCAITYYKSSCDNICRLIEQEEGRDDLVDCYTDSTCGGSRRRMSRELCCVKSRGVSYAEEGDEISCRICVVYGFPYECTSFIEEEQEEPYEIVLGYIKGKEEVDQDITFQISSTLQTASVDDFNVSTDSVLVRVSDTELQRFEVTLIKDGIAREPNENFALELAVRGRGPEGRNVFFLDNKNITIVDADEKCSYGIDRRCPSRNPALCACATGYKEPDCCQCVDGFILDPDNVVCIEVCSEGVVSCTGGVCECHANYTGIDCCECAVGYYREESTGLCLEYCDPGLMGCSDGVCTCDTGYTGPGCCQCVPGFVRSDDDNTCVGKCLVGLEDCGSDPQLCACNQGYLEPDCCNCVDGYYKDPSTMECLMPCSEGVVRCTGGVCECHASYTGVRCCECAVGYYRDETTKLCLEFCDPGLLSCSTTSCTCDTGYTGPGCCQCAAGYVRVNDTCVEERCSVGVESCSRTRCICRTGYSGADCCDCATGYFRDQSSTTVVCIAPCFEGVEGTCSDDEGCTCRPGYVGGGCCECDSNYYRSRCSDNGCALIELQDEDEANLINCYTEDSCRGTNRRMTPELCCVEFNGISFQSEASETCTLCVVYGWSDTCDPFRAPEREESYSFELGFIKGRSEFGQSFSWRLEPQLINASNSDFTINTLTVSVSSSSSVFSEARVTFILDGVAQEGDESFNISLAFDDISQPRGAGFFFVRSKQFIIIDDESTCATGVTSCDANGDCTCRRGYLPPSCCDCDEGYIKGDNGVCLVRCSEAQDIYFLIDATNSNEQIAFCQEMYAVQLLTAAFGPRQGDDRSGTRVGTYLYSKTNEDIPGANYTYFEPGSFSCNETLEYYHRLMLAYAIDEADLTDNNLKDIQKQHLRGSITVPEISLNYLADQIEADVQNHPDLRRIVIIVTDGLADSLQKDIQAAIDNLKNKSGSDLTLVAAGVSSLIASEEEFNFFQGNVTLLADNNQANSYVTPRDASNPGIDLGIELVNIMERNEAICKTQADFIRDVLTNSTRHVYYCDCNVNLPFPGLPDTPCVDSCPADIYKNGAGRDDCQTPPIEACSSLLPSALV